MTKSDNLRERYEKANARQWDADMEVYATDLKFHAPGLGQDLQGRDEAFAMVQAFIETSDVHYEVKDVVELGPFVLGLVASTGNIGGERKGWEVLHVERYEGATIVELWSLRGSEPKPVTATASSAQGGAST